MTPATPAQPKKTLTAVVGAACCAVLLSYVPQFEGTVLRGYKDPIGVVTACSGNTASAVLGKAYTPEQCAQMLETDLVQHAEPVLACIHVPVTTGEKAAYISFGFNVGAQAFCGSTANAKLNAGDHAGACAELSRWDKAGGKVLPGLVKRRAIERQLCEGKYDQPKAKEQ